MKRELISTICAAILVMLFLYTALNKMLDYDVFKDAMSSQPIAPWMASLLVKTLPATEIIVSILLSIPRTRLIGFYCSLILMVSFTVYIGLGIVHAFTRVPCSCGGIFNGMGWQSHFLINLFFIATVVTGIINTTNRSKINAEGAHIKFG